MIVHAVAALAVDGATSPPTTAAGIPAEMRDWVVWEILIFIAILSAAFAYAWRKGVFEWR